MPSVILCCVMLVHPGREIGGRPVVSWEHMPRRPAGSGQPTNMHDLKSALRGWPEHAVQTDICLAQQRQPLGSRSQRVCLHRCCWWWLPRLPDLGSQEAPTEEPRST